MKIWEKYYDCYTVDEFKAEFVQIRKECDDVIKAFADQERYVQNVLVAKSEYLSKLLAKNWAVLFDFGGDEAGLRTEDGQGILTLPYTCVEDYIFT